MEAVAYTLKSLGLVTEINECRAVSLCGLVVSALNWQLRGIGFDPTKGSSISFIYCGIVQKSNLANLALFIIITLQ